MSETKKCRKCGETKPLEAFHSGLVCRACRNEQQRIYRAEHSIKPLRFVFDDLLARWVLTHARKPNRGARKWLLGASPNGMHSDCHEIGYEDYVYFHFNDFPSKQAYPYFGNPMVVYQHETGELLSNVRAKENAVERSEQEVLGDCEFDRGEDEAERTDVFPGLLAYLPKGQVSRHAGI